MYDVNDPTNQIIMDRNQTAYQATYSGKDYDPISEEVAANGALALINDEKYREGTRLARGQCGEFVNDILMSEYGMP